MKWLVLLILAVSMFAITCLYRAARTGRCRMTCVNGDTFDWGILDEGASIEHGFLIRNEGKSELVIQDVKSGCGCTKAEISRRILAPNETATLRVTYTARRIPERERIGVAVISNDKAAPVKEFVMTGLVRFAVRCRPRSLSFDLSADGDVACQTLHFETNMGSLELLNCSAPDSLALEWDKKGRAYVCSVQPKAGFRGPVNQEIAVEFSVDGKAKSIAVPVYILH